MSGDADRVHGYDKEWYAVSFAGNRRNNQEKEELLNDLAIHFRENKPSIDNLRMRLVNCGQGRSRTADTRIFSCRSGTMCHYRSLLVSIQAFDAGFSRSILPIRAHSVI